MPGTRTGGIKAAKTNKTRYGKDHYVKLGATGGRKSRGGGFAANPELAREAGRKGGAISRRGKAKESSAMQATKILQAELDEAKKSWRVKVGI